MPVDTDVAPLWDPEKRSFVGLMTVSDYIQTVRIWRAQSYPTSELTNRSISDMLVASPLRFRHTGYEGIDAEDTVHQLCLLLLRTCNDYVPVVDADNGNLVSILGYLDILHLLNQTAKMHPTIFHITIQQASIGTFKNILTAPRNARLFEILDALDVRNISAVPVVDEASRVVGVYHRSDVSFIIKATDPDAVVQNLSQMKVEESLVLRDQLLQSGEIMSSFQGLVTAKLSDTMGFVINAMTVSRATRVIIVDEQQKCLGVVSVRDLVQYYMNHASAVTR